MKQQQQATWAPDDWKPRKGPHRLAPSKQQRWMFVREFGEQEAVDSVSFGAWAPVTVRVNGGQWRHIPHGNDLTLRTPSGVRRIEVIRPRRAGVAVRVVGRLAGVMRWSVQVRGERPSPSPIVSGMAQYEHNAIMRRMAVEGEGGSAYALSAPNPLARLAAAEFRANFIARSGHFITRVDWSAAPAP